MTSRDDLPLFNLRAVVQETGLTPDALRAWERRYGLPHPERTSGGHRLYSKREIETLKWLVARQQEGLSISKAVRLWNQLRREGNDPLLMPEYASSHPSPEVQIAAEGSTVAGLCEAWISACLDFNEQRADDVLTQAFGLYPAELVCVHVLQEGLAAIGRGWYRSEVSVQQEHFASELAMRKLESLVAASPVPTRPTQILAACPPNEDHVFGLLLLTFLLRRRGWPVLFLGANVPIEDLVASLAGRKIPLVVSAAQLLNTVADLAEMARVLRDAGVRLAYGGSIFARSPRLKERIPGFYLGDHLEHAPGVVEQLVTSPPPMPPVPDHLQVNPATRQGFLAQVPRLESLVRESMEGTEIRPHQMASANQDLSRVIMAALTLGDAVYLEDEVGWVRDRLASQGVALPTIERYLRAYSQALKDQLDPYGDPILAQLIPHL